jgi:hypothetical protein
MRSVLGFSRKPAPATAAPERPTRAVVLPPEVVELRDELSALLLDLDEGHAVTWRHLVVVHDELGARGWPGVEALPARVLRKARIQAEMLASREPSQLLADFVERLQLVEIAAAVRDGEEPMAAEPARQPEEELAAMSQFVEVSDTSFEEYELMERSWVGTVPSGLGKPGRENWPATPGSDQRTEARPVVPPLPTAQVIEGTPAPLEFEPLEVPALVEKPEPPVLVERLEMPVLVEKLETPETIEFEPPLLVETFEPPRRDVRPQPSEHWVDFDRD